jgi:hypothetical protein
MDRIRGFRSKFAHAAARPRTRARRRRGTWRDLLDAPPTTASDRALHPPG